MFSWSSTFTFLLTFRVSTEYFNLGIDFVYFYHLCRLSVFVSALQWKTEVMLWLLPWLHFLVSTSYYFSVSSSLLPTSSPPAPPAQFSHHLTPPTDLHSCSQSSLIYFSTEETPACWHHLVSSLLVLPSDLYLTNMFSCCLLSFSTWLVWLPVFELGLISVDSFSGILPVSPGFVHWVFELPAWY